MEEKIKEKIISFRFDNELVTQLELQAKAEKRSVSDLIREACKNYIYKDLNTEGELLIEIEQIRQLIFKIDRKIEIQAGILNEFFQSFYTITRGLEGLSKEEILARKELGTKRKNTMIKRFRKTLNTTKQGFLEMILADYMLEENVLQENKIDLSKAAEIPEEREY